MEKKSKSKIEKFDKHKEYRFEAELTTDIMVKINEIIDYLNSQDQGEEKTVCEGCGKAVISRFMQSYSRDDGLHYYCLSCNPETEDTPEEWEEDEVLYQKIEEIHSFGPHRWNTELLKLFKQLLDKAREEGRREVYEAIVFDENIPHDITTFVAANLWKNMRDKAKEELSKLKQ